MTQRYNTLCVIKEGYPATYINSIFTSNSSPNLYQSDMEIPATTIYCQTAPSTNSTMKILAEAKCRLFPHAPLTPQDLTHLDFENVDFILGDCASDAMVLLSNPSLLQLQPPARYLRLSHIDYETVFERLYLYTPSEISDLAHDREIISILNRFAPLARDGRVSKKLCTAVRGYVRIKAGRMKVTEEEKAEVRARYRMVNRLLFEADFGGGYGGG